MRERINRLARGIVDSSVPELVIKTREDRRGSFAGRVRAGRVFRSKRK